MDFLPQTPADVRAMLETIGVESVDELFDSIPSGVRLKAALDVPPAMSEVDLIDHLGGLARAARGADDLVCFAGGGMYDHYTPAAVRSLASRAEFSTSYTPYQPELSQGVLQAIFEFQTLVCEIYALEVSNASLYDGASALGEAVNLAVRATGRDAIVIGATVHPHYRQVLKTCTSGLGIRIETIEAGADGTVDWGSVAPRDAAAVIVASPNFLGLLEDVAGAAAVAHDAGALAISVTDPTAMGVLQPPGEAGVDVAVGDGAALGNAMSYGGPTVGLFATRLDLVRQVPGRIAGETIDADGRRAYVLTLQAREQHIRRARATSNVCTNQTLMAIAAAVHLSWLGPQGLHRLGDVCLRRTAFAARRLSDVRACRVRFAGPKFKEFVLETPKDGEEVAAGLARRGYLAGPALGRWYPEMSNCLLVAVTERRSEDDIDGLAEALEKELAD